MQQLIDYAAVLAFLIAYFVSGDIFIATAVSPMIGVTLQLLAYKLLRKPIGNELKLTFWVSMVLGGLTLIVRDEAFIQWKPISSIAYSPPLCWGRCGSTKYFYCKNYWARQ